MKSRKISSHYVLTPQGLLPRGILSFDAEGTLIEITTADSLDACAGVEFFDGLLVPGLVNAHCHLELSYLRGRIARGGGFAAFAEEISAVRDEATEAERERAMHYRDARMYAEGIAVVGDICNGSSSFPLKARSPIHYHNFVEFFGLRSNDTAAARRTADAAAEPIFVSVDSSSVAHGLPYSMTPHSTYSVQQAPFGELAAQENPLSIHFMESEGERELFVGRGPLHKRNQREGVQIDFAQYGSPAERIIAQVPADRNLLLVHNTYVTKEEVQRLQDHFGDHLTWVLCPRSNAYIEGAMPPVSMLRSMGVRLAVGTDSLASNDDLSLMEELKCFSGVPLDELFGWVTRNGAEALGVGEQFGNFRVGTCPGATLIEGVDWTHGTLRPGATSTVCSDSRGIPNTQDNVRV